MNGKNILGVEFFFIRPVFLLAIATVLFGCDSSEPEVVEDALITRVDVRLLHSETNQSILASVSGDNGLMAGAVYQADTLVIEPGSVYTGQVEFFDSQGQGVTRTVRKAAENYQLFYTVKGADGVRLKITDVESDYGPNEFGADLKVGLVFEITVSEGIILDEGGIRIRLGEFGRGLKNGVTLVVEPTVDIVVPFRVENPPGSTAPDLITQAELTLVRSDGTETWTATAVDPQGLAFGGYDVPDNMHIEGCTVDGSGTSVCREEAALILTDGVYTGEWYLSDFETGQNLTEEIRNRGNWHQFFYSDIFNSFDIYIQDLDSNGLPIGLSFDLVTPQQRFLSGTLRVRLAHFSSAQGDAKDGHNVGLEADLQFGIRMRVVQNGPPETITRTVVMLHRSDDQEDIIITASGTDLLHADPPDSLVIETCTGPPGQQACSTGDTLELLRGSSYTGTIEVYNDATGENVMQEIIDEGIWHQFFWLDRNMEIVSTGTDTDANGNPIGFQFDLTISATAEGSLSIMLAHYGRFSIKGEEHTQFREWDMFFCLPTVFR